MKTADVYQVGGQHYRAEYQHWDWVCDIDLHYYPACATKYICRWRIKNGHEDLNKAVHFLEKAQAREIGMPAAHAASLISSNEADRLTGKFLRQSCAADRGAMLSVYLGNYAGAIRKIKEMIDVNV